MVARGRCHIACTRQTAMDSDEPPVWFEQHMSESDQHALLLFLEDHPTDTKGVVGLAKVPRQLHCVPTQVMTSDP